jgi:2-iminobutanoate/2-iminopropanoate deaminase
MTHALARRSRGRDASCAVLPVMLGLLGITTLTGHAAGQQPRPRMEHVLPDGEWEYPFSPAVRVGDMLYLSGQIGSAVVDGRMELVTGGIEAETRQTMENIREVLERSGSSLDRVVRCLVMLTDMREWPRMNEVYASYFPGPKPARSAVGANGLALGARVEIECTAIVD